MTDKVQGAIAAMFAVMASGGFAIGVMGGWYHNINLVFLGAFLTLLGLVCCICAWNAEAYK